MDIHVSLWQRISGAGYLLNNIINGIGEWPDTNDWYSFLTWGYPAGIAIFAVICAVTWLLGLAMRKLQKYNGKGTVPGRKVEGDLG